MGHGEQLLYIQIYQVGCRRKYAARYCAALGTRRPLGSPNNHQPGQQETVLIS